MLTGVDFAFPRPTTWRARPPLDVTETTMSLSTQGGEQPRPNVVTVGGKPGGGKAAAKTPPTNTTKGGGKGGGPRKPIAPIKVNQGRNWGPIALFTAVGLLAAGIVGWGAWAAFKPGGDGYGWKTQASQISGIVNFRDKGEIKSGHSYNPEKYDQSPPIGGPHNYILQNCMGDVYTAPIPSEHAVHSLEHGAIWVTYRNGLPQDQVAKLAAKVTGKPYMLMSPYEGLDKAVSLQAWGYQLKLDDVNDPRIDAFIKALRINATMEPGAACTGNTATGTTPLTEEQAKALQEAAAGAGSNG